MPCRPGTAHKAPGDSLAPPPTRKAGERKGEADSRFDAVARKEELRADIEAEPDVRRQSHEHGTSDRRAEGTAAFAHDHRWTKHDHEADRRLGRCGHIGSGKIHEHPGPIAGVDADAGIEAPSAPARGSEVKLGIPDAP